ncbi:hypothetical protein J1N35_034740 [Gossypium stocksii]|uniref:Uncharacterized protein n=1 Tax=Gossypium stocksii TaxID=47602 RepID=A0A9D3UT44_9ROSI|nr:hypothetical protein J1N35_034740 [Gossypium stocksii]
MVVKSRFNALVNINGKEGIRVKRSNGDSANFCGEDRVARPLSGKKDRMGQSSIEVVGGLEVGSKEMDLRVGPTKSGVGSKSQVKRPIQGTELGSTIFMQEGETLKGPKETHEQYGLAVLT